MLTHEHRPSFESELYYQAAKAYEKHCEENGKPDSHAKAKEIMAGFAGAFIDRAIETKGLDFIDKEKAKRHGMYLPSSLYLLAC